MAFIRPPVRPTLRCANKQVKKMQKAADKGKAAVEVGSFEDGIGHYRTAIAVDPSHAVGYSCGLRVGYFVVCG